MTNLEHKAKQIRLWALEQAASKGKAHLGGTFSCVDILVAIYDCMNVQKGNPRWDNRDRLILSKGHACLGLYPLIAELNFVDQNRIESYGTNGGLGGQLDVSIPGVEWNTGSLGHALGVGAGMAMSAVMDKKDFHTFVIVGDAECAEGSVWEAFLFIGQKRLSNLTCIVDRNRLSVTEVLDDDSFFRDLPLMLKAVGWNCIEVDGHNIDAIVHELNKCRQSELPTIIIANTIKGKGVSFMENGAKWHHSIPGPQELEIARRELK